MFYQEKKKKIKKLSFRQKFQVYHFVYDQVIPLKKFDPNLREAPFDHILMITQPRTQDLK